MSLREMGLETKTNAETNTFQFDASPAASQTNEVVGANDNQKLEETNSSTAINDETQLPAEQSKLPKEELAILLEGFASVLRNKPSGMMTSESAKEQEILGLKELLMEAQETIITLLNDRVYDRSKIAKLETEIRLLPDLQSQANRAMGLALVAEDVQSDLAAVKLAVEKLKTSQMRTEMVQFHRPWWRRFFGG